MSPDTRAALIGELRDATCAVPFEHLGMHPTHSGGVLLRVWQPGVESIEAIDAGNEGALGSMRRIEATDLFELDLPELAEPVPYRLKIHGEGEPRDVWDPYQFHSVDLYEGPADYQRLYRTLGAHGCEVSPAPGVRVAGTRFAVYAPQARSVSLVGDFNAWDGRRHPMQSSHDGVWRLFVPGLGPGQLYKYEVKAPNGDVLPRKADPFGRYHEQSPGNASIVHDGEAYRWNDGAWRDRPYRDAVQQPMSTYEVHLGSWKRRDGRPLTYRELADELVAYVSDLGYTHIELLPVTEHPFTGSWGYQPLGLFAPTSRFGPPDDFKYFVDCCHQAGLAVILDWVPAHFPSDECGLTLFDGTPLYEHPDPRRGWHPDWDTHVYDYGRDYVRDFLISSALFWLDEFHVDGLRVDAVASMLYLDYSRGPGEWSPNQFGGRENLEAIEFIKRFNESVYGAFPKAVTIAEESTAWPRVSSPTYEDGLGFGFKWNMGWMHDTLRYFSKNPVHRKHHHNDITFSLIYAFSEKFVLPLSHDEVVHMKGSLLRKMPGDEWQRFANLRLLYAYMYAHPGKKLLFMGSELAQWGEWNHDGQLEWAALENEYRRGVQKLVRDLNHRYRSEPSLFQLDHLYQGFDWIDHGDVDQSVISFTRYAEDRDDHIVVICNMTPVVRGAYRVGVPASGRYREILNTDSSHYAGTNVGNLGAVATEPVGHHSRAQSLTIGLPPLATLWLKYEP